MRRIALLAVALLLLAGPVAGDVPPRHDYVLHCSGCHRANGSGAPDAVPSLVGIDRFLARSEGRAYLVRAPGVAQAPLSDGRLAALMNWVVAEFGIAGSSPGYTAAEVGRLRVAPLRDPTGLRARLLAPETDGTVSPRRTP